MPSVGLLTLDIFYCRTLPFQEMPLVDVFSSFRKLLSTEDAVEGVVIVTGSGEVFKWKGAEETFSKERSANFQKLGSQIGDKWPLAWQSIKAVGKFALSKQVSSSLMGLTVWDSKTVPQNLIGKPKFH